MSKRFSCSSSKSSSVWSFKSLDSLMIIVDILSATYFCLLLNTESVVNVCRRYLWINLIKSSSFFTELVAFASIFLYQGFLPQPNITYRGPGFLMYLAF